MTTEESGAKYTPGFIALMKVAGGLSIADAALRVLGQISGFFFAYGHFSYGHWFLFEVVSTGMEVFALYMLVLLLKRGYGLSGAKWAVYIMYGGYVILTAAFPFDKVIGLGYGPYLSVISAGVLFLVAGYVVLIIMAHVHGGSTPHLFKAYCYVSIAGLALNLSSLVPPLSLLIVSGAEVMLALLFFREANGGLRVSVQGEDGVAALAREAREIGERLEWSSSEEERRELMARYGAIDHELQARGLEKEALDSAFREERDPHREFSKAGMGVYIGLVLVCAVLGMTFNAAVGQGTGSLLSPMILPAMAFTGPQWLFIEVQRMPETPDSIFLVSMFYFPFLFAPLGFLLVFRRFAPGLIALQVVLLILHLVGGYILLVGAALSG